MWFWNLEQARPLRSRRACLVSFFQATTCRLGKSRKKDYTFNQICAVTKVKGSTSERDTEQHALSGEDAQRTELAKLLVRASTATSGNAHDTHTHVTGFV